jgi:hypothetical protein
MKNDRCWKSLGYLALTTILIFSFMMGCSNEADKRIKTAENLYLQFVNYRKAGETKKAMEKFKQTLNEYQQILDSFPNSSLYIHFPTIFNNCSRIRDISGNWYCQARCTAVNLGFCYLRYSLMSRYSETI